MRSCSVPKASANRINCVHFQGDVLLVWGSEQQRIKKNGNFISDYKRASDLLIAFCLFLDSLYLLPRKQSASSHPKRLCAEIRKNILHVTL